MTRRSTPMLPDERIASTLESPLLEDATWSISVQVDGEPVHEHNVAGDILDLATAGRILALVHAAERIHVRDLDIEQTVPKACVDPVGGRGVWRHLRAPVLLCVGDLGVLSGAAADNLATNALLKVLGLDAVQARAEDLTSHGTTILDEVRDVRFPDPEDYDETEEVPVHPDAMSAGEARDLASVMGFVGQGLADMQSAMGLVCGWIATPADHSMVEDALRLRPITDVVCEHRFITGSDDGVRAEAGVLLVGERLVSYAFVCNWTPVEPRVSAAVSGAMRILGSVVRDLADPAEYATPTT